MPETTYTLSKIGVGTVDFLVKDDSLTVLVTQLVEAISGNNDSIVNRINNLNERSFDAEIKISSANESEISNIVDGLYKIQYVTITGEGDDVTETLNNSAILIQKGTNQYLIKDGQILSRTKSNDEWSSWESNNVKPDWEASTGSAAEILNKPDLSNYITSIKTVNNESLIGTGNVVVSGLPQVSSADNGKILMVVNGQWQLVSPSVLYSGQGVPNNAQGNNGDLYMQTD